MDNAVSDDSDVFSIAGQQSTTPSPVLQPGTPKELPNPYPDLYVKSMNIKQNSGNGSYNLEFYPVIGNKGGKAVDKNFAVELEVKNLTYGGIKTFTPYNYGYDSRKILEPGGDTSAYNHFWVYQSPKPGNFRCTVKVDSARKIKEQMMNRANNVKVFTETVLPLPDLEVCGMTKEKLLIGDMVKIRVVVKSKGDKDSAPCKMAVYVNQNKIQELAFPEIKAGFYYAKSIEPFPWEKTVGNVFLFVDSGKEIEEINEKNNVVKFVIYGYPNQALLPQGVVRIGRCAKYEHWLAFK
jgi:hypothetical protein